MAGTPEKPASEKPLDPTAPPPAPPSRLRWLIRKFWYLHSTWALLFGFGVMLFARRGLSYADELLVLLCGAFFLLFIAFRFILGPTNRRPDEKLPRRGLRLATNYLIKNFYQQVFFFLVPLYASSTTWSLQSWNWWLAPILLVFGILSTMDLVMDNVVMEKRLFASLMYGVAMFALLNVLLPLVFKVNHRDGLVVAAACTPTAVALLSYRVKSVMSPQGVLATLGATTGLIAFVWFGRILLPPAPLSMPESTVGHGSISTYECLPPSAHAIRASQLDGLRCGSWLEEPGGMKEDVVHIWKHDGEVVARLHPERIPCDGDGAVYRSFLTPLDLPHDPIGKWTCETMTVGGQLVGLRNFEVIVGEPVVPGMPSGDAGVPDGGGSKDAGP